jgi:Ring hydroxylating alpha subunit (catalytic domain)
MAQYFRNMLGIADPSGASTTELIDTHGYLVFPSGHFFLGQTFPIAYRIRPLDDGPDRALFELLVLRSSANGAEPPAAPIRLKVTESYATVPGISPSFAAIMDQDTSITGWQQEGFKASAKKAVTLASYQEVRIRHAHQTLDAYLATPPGEPVRFGGSRSPSGA